MDLDDLFENGRRRGKHGHGEHDNSHEYDDHREDDGHRGYDDQRGTDRHNGHHDDQLFDLSSLMPRLMANKKLLVVGGLVALVLIIALVVLVLPLLGQLLGYVDQAGLKGVVERVWQGANEGK